jgi:hypothetical protein
MQGGGCNIGSGANSGSSSSGAKTLSGTLDRLRFTNNDGDNFSAGGSVGLQIIHAVT